MRLFLTAASLAALSLSAGAAQAAPTDWVDVAVDRVSAEQSGDCLVSGWVVSVRDGPTFEPGSEIDFDVPCADTGVSERFDGELSGSALAAHGIAMTASVKLDPSGRVLDYVGTDTRTDGESQGVIRDTRTVDPGDGDTEYQDRQAAEPDPQGEDMDARAMEEPPYDGGDDEDAPPPPEDNPQAFFF